MSGWSSMFKTYLLMFVISFASWDNFGGFGVEMVSWSPFTEGKDALLGEDEAVYRVAAERRRG